MMEIQTLKTDKQLMHSSLVDERGQLVTKHCALCHKDILNTPIVLPENPNSTFYHRQCFRCADCQTLLSIRGGYRYHEERFYCIAHDPAAAPITRSCAHCHEAIAAGSEIPALDRFWHPHHLACSVCHTSAVTGNPFDFVDHQGRIFCRDDYTRLFLPKCQRCTQPVDGDALFALNAKWHPECFNCDVCHEFFPNKSFYVFENKPHCRYHYHMRNQSLCHGCQQPIEGPCAQVQEGRFHPACFTCRVCRYPLRDVYYNVDNSFYCERHAHAIQSNLPTGGLTRRRTQMRHL
ncbi:hypothetical protein H4R35_007525 [Dimargaris xerosporica]|nr:hypothetical protein H4R35_007525 [Dimargaris xerosporica]